MVLIALKNKKGCFHDPEVKIKVSCIPKDERGELSALVILLHPEMLKYISEEEFTRVNLFTDSENKRLVVIKKIDKSMDASCPTITLPSKTRYYRISATWPYYLPANPMNRCTIRYLSSDLGKTFYPHKEGGLAIVLPP